MFPDSKLKAVLLLGAATSATALTMQGAYAQDAAPETVVVTGTRIPNRDFVSDSPISTVSADFLTQTGSIDITQVLATLPQVVPAVSGGSNNPSSTPGGQQNIDLRGLGAKRVVVLIDGQRAAPSNKDGTVDLQTIPTSLISRVEIVTGGESAVYGADAITGVVNFIMKNDFQGVAADVQYGISDRGDDAELTGSLTVGGNFDAGRGNVVMTYDYAYRRELFDSARDFASQATTSTSRSPTGSYNPSSGNQPSQAALNSYFATHGGAPAGTVKPADALGFNPDGTLFDFGGSNGSFSVYNYKADPSYPARLFCADPATPTNCRTFSYNFQPPNLLLLPLKRQNFMAMGHYQINPDLTFYMSTRFTNYTSATSLAPTPAPTAAVTSPDGGRATSGYIVPVSNPFIPADLATILASRTGTPTSSASTLIPGTGPTADFLVVTRFLALGPRLQDETNDVFQETAGLRGKLPFTNLNFDIYASYGQLDNVETQFGNVSNSAVENLLFGKGSGDCTGYSDLNPFGPLKFGPNSLACIQRVTKNSTVTTFTNMEGTVNGQLFDLDGGTASFSLGASYREQTYNFIADPLLGAGDVSGFTPEKSISGAVYDQDLFGELYLPLFKDLPFADFISVTLGGRLTEQAHTFHGNAWTWKAQGDWGVSRGITFRTSFEVATRMPNIDELFSTDFADTPSLADPCNFDSPFRTGPNAAKVVALCTAQGAGSATFSQSNGQMSVLSAGNPNLKPETADTFTAGVSWQSTWGDPWLSGLAGTLDYWNIDLHSPIGIDSFDILYGCFNYDGSNPTYSNTNANCQKLSRSGGSMYIFGDETNLAKDKLDGFDLALNWALDLQQTMDADPIFNRLLFNLSTTYWSSYVVQGTPGGLGVDYVGTIGSTSPIGTDTDAAFPRLKGQLTTTLGLFDTAQISARFTYIDGMKSALAPVGWTGLNFGIGTVHGVPATIYTDIYGSWQLTDYLTLRAGVNNLADLSPRQYNPSQQDGTDPASYDIIGRRYFLGLGLKL
ncbi:MAG TPA: TonB-dependent receptor [Rhizomicrobium sp.]|nr:TonB-dependent receptor [Rhizomicrobium sp.]